MITNQFESAYLKNEVDHGINCEFDYYHAKDNQAGTDCLNLTTPLFSNM